MVIRFKAIIFDSELNLAREFVTSNLNYMEVPIIDSASQKLLSELITAGYNISFKHRNDDYCEVFTRNKEAIIYYNRNNVTTESIAHELLHVWLKKFNYHTGNHLYLITRNDNKLNLIISKLLCDHITNCCDHFKMYPQFIRMGYDPSKFIKDSLFEQASLKFINSIKLKMFWTYQSNAINWYIGSLISILAHHIEHNYNEHHSKLLRKDPDLYYIITKFWKSWKLFDIENIDVIYNYDLDLTNTLASELNEWCKNKIIR